MNRTDPGRNFNEARKYFQKRLAEMEELGLNPKRFEFKATFGRELEYYTGFVFQIEVETPDGFVAVAGGGRYDNLLSDMGSPVACVRRGLRHSHRAPEGGAGMKTLTLAIPSKGRLMEQAAAAFGNGRLEHRAPGHRARLPWPVERH